MLAPPVIALLLIAILLPAIALMVLYARKVAVRRAERGGLGSGRLHVAWSRCSLPLPRADRAGRDLRLAAVPERPRILVLEPCAQMLENTVQVARATYGHESAACVETTTMAADMAMTCCDVPIDDPRSPTALLLKQVLNRALNEARSSSPWSRKGIRTLAVVKRVRSTARQGSVCRRRRAARHLADAVVDVKFAGPRGALDPAQLRPNTYLYAARVFDPEFPARSQRANDVLRRLPRAARTSPRSTSCVSMRRFCSAR